jgi:PGF-pre-PGF domain-containing protein
VNRTHLLLVGTLIAAAVLVPTGAFSPGPTDDISNNISLYPSDSPDGKYAYIDDETGELVVDISAANPNVEGPVGVSPDSVTTFENVFRIHYNGSQYANVWLTHGSDAVTFSARDKSIQSESSAVRLGPNESVGVNVHVDTTGDVQRIRADEMTIHARVAEPSDTQSGGGDTDGETDSTSLPSVQEEDEDDSLTVTVTESATGERDVTIRNLTPGAVVEMDLGGLYIVDGAITLDSVQFESTTAGDANLTFSQQSAQSVPVEPIGTGSGIDPLGYFTLNHTIPNSAVENVSMRFSANWSYLDANGIDPAEVRMLRHGADGWTVLETDRRVGTEERAHFVTDSPGLSTYAVGVRTSRFVTSEVAVSPTTIQAGETATVTAEVTNRGAIAGRTTVSLSRNGSVVRNRTLALDAGENATVRFDISPSAPGTHAFAVNGRAAGTVTVASPTTPTPTPTVEPPATPTPTPMPTETVEPSATPTPTATPSDSGVSTGQEPTETVPVSDEAAGFDIVALAGLVAIVVLVAVVARLRRRQDA